MLVAISDGSLHQDEVAFRDWLLAIGPYVDRILFREKAWSKQAQADFLQDLLTKQPSLREILVIHSHFGLAEKFSLKGCHFSPGQVAPAELARLRKGYSGEVSGSFHMGQEPGAYQDLAWCFFSPVFATSCKPGAKATGLKALEDFVRTAGIPVVALGGITFHNSQACLEAGARGIAMRSHLVGRLAELKEYRLRRKI